MGTDKMMVLYATLNDSIKGVFVDTSGTFFKILFLKGGEGVISYDIYCFFYIFHINKQ